MEPEHALNGWGGKMSDWKLMNCSEINQCLVYFLYQDVLVHKN
jgi:hypothetical protein